MNNVLVTGGSGFLGSHLIEKLVALGFNIKVLDNNWRGSKRNLEGVKNEIEFIEADVRNYEAVKQATKDVDIIFHLASIQGTKKFYLHPELVIDVGILGNINVAKATVENNVKRVLFTSSSEIYGDPNVFPTSETHPATIPDTTNPRYAYALQKLVGESIFLNYARKFSFDVSIVRIHNAYGPRMGWDHVMPEFIKRLILNENFTVQGTGNETRSFCFVDDIIDGIILAATKDEGKNEIFNIGNPEEEMSINQLIEHLKNVTNKDIAPVYIERPEGSTLRRKPDITKARKMLGFTPKVIVEEGLRKTFEWYENEIKWHLENTKPEERPWLK